MILSAACELWSLLYHIEFITISRGYRVNIKADVPSVSAFAAGAVANQTAAVFYGDDRSLTVYASAARSSAQNVKIALSGGAGSYGIPTGAKLLSLSAPVNLVIPAGQDHVTVALVDLAGTSTPDVAAANDAEGRMRA